MNVTKLSSGTCPVARSLARVGDAWSMLILRDVSLGLSRYEQLRESLGIAPNILSRRLKALAEAGLIEKRRYCAAPPRYDYVLTAAGSDFLPVLHVLGQWGRTHHGEGGVSTLVDSETGAEVRPLVVDAATGAPLGARPLRLVKP